MGSPERDRVDAIIGRLCALQRNGGTHDLWSYEDLEWRMNQGRPIEVYCGVMSVLVQRELDREGIQNRLICTMTKLPYTDDNGHSMNEVKIDGTWHIYDADNDRAFEDGSGNGINVVQLCATHSSTGRPHRRLGDPNEPLASWLQGNPDPEAALNIWYDRVFQVPMIEIGQPYPYCNFAFHHRGQRARLEAYQGNYLFVGADRWERILNA